MLLITRQEVRMMRQVRAWMSSKGELLVRILRGQTRRLNMLRKPWTPQCKIRDSKNQNEKRERSPRE